MFYGVDISYANGNYQPNTETFIIVNASRANVGLVVGSMYHTQVQTARAHGKEVGHYFFNGNTDPVTCANFFVDNLYDFRSGDVLVLDVESEAGTNTAAWSPAQTLAFSKQVYARTGVKVGIYLNRSLMDGNDWSAVVAFGCWLWIAYYNQTPPPITWWPTWTVWQWTSAGGLDKNQAKQSLASIRTEVSGGGATPIPILEEDDMPRIIHITGPAKNEEIWVVDHDQHTKWNLAANRTNMDDINAFKAWLIAQGAIEVGGIQPASYLAGYRDITAPVAPVVNVPAPVVNVDEAAIVKGVVAALPASTDPATITAEVVAAIRSLAFKAS